MFHQFVYSLVGIKPVVASIIRASKVVGFINSSAI